MAINPIGIMKSAFGGTLSIFKRLQSLEYQSIKTVIHQFNCHLQFYFQEIMGEDGFWKNLSRLID